jgi:preprotein translocase subunit YajC
MSFFISDALADGAAAAPTTGDSLLGFLPLIAMVVLFYFILIRPQSKRAKEHKAMVEALQKGDEVVTQGGILGRITQVNENFVAVEISRDVIIHVQKHAVTAMMPKGTVKELN